MKSWLAPLLLLCQSAVAMASEVPSPAEIDGAVERVMAETGGRGLAIAVIDGGQIVHLRAYGESNAAGDLLRTDTVMYGASLTKTVFAYTVLGLVDRGVLSLDTPLADYLDRPLPEYDTESIYPDKYGPYHHLAGDPRWRRITARHVLTHSTGFANFWWDEPDRTLRIHFDPGTRYSYSGEGMILLQFAIENGRKEQGLGLDLEALTDDVFVDLGMTSTSLVWRDDFRPNLADGFDDQGKPVEHDERSKVRVAGSMDTTIADLAQFARALARREGLSAAGFAEMLKPQLHIGSAHQFPVLAPELPEGEQRADLFAGLGLVVFEGPQGRGFFKGGHNESTANTLVCLERGQRCVLILSNDVRTEAGFAELVRFILGDTGVPYDWEYGDHAGKS